MRWILVGLIAVISMIPISLIFIWRLGRWGPGYFTLADFAVGWFGVFIVSLLVAKATSNEDSSRRW